jgi:uncharacterized protein with GYD domain
MSTYISLINWTEQGVQGFKDTVARAKAATDLAAKMGGELKSIYWTVGEYDIITVAEFPDDQTGTAFLLKLGAQGNVRTKTLQAHTADEMTEIIAKAS